MERDIQASECMSSVVHSHQMMQSGREQQNRKKYHHNPLADEDSLGDSVSEDDFLGGDDGQLGITRYPGASEFRSEPSKPKQGFVKASAVLDKYEAKELTAQGKGGFVSFKSKLSGQEEDEVENNKKQHRTVNIPEHLRKGMPDPLAKYKTKPNNTLKSSVEYASNTERLKAELAEIEKKRAAARAKLGLSAPLSGSTTKPLPAPSLSFKRYDITGKPK